jgi:FkbM family methyltransferase
MSPPISLGDIMRLLYGGNHDVNDGVLHTLRAALGKDVVETMADVRTVTMTLDRQTFPTPVVVRFSREDIRFVPINGIQCPVDRHDISVCLPSALSASWEPHLVACFRKTCRPGSVVLDIGASVGYHTLLLATLAGSQGKCYAFEPNSENCRLILLGCERNCLSNITLMPVALSDQPGWEYFSSHIGSNGGFITEQFVALHGHGTVVPVFALDGLPLPNVDLIKVDVEGAEYKALKGGEALLSRSRPAIVSEFSVEMTRRVSQVSPEHYLHWIAGMDYQLYVLDRKSCEPVAVDSVSALLDGWGSCARIEDLLFLPREKVHLVERP